MDFFLETLLGVRFTSLCSYNDIRINVDMRFSFTIDEASTTFEQMSDRCAKKPFNYCLMQRRQAYKSYLTDTHLDRWLKLLDLFKWYKNCS